MPSPYADQVVTVIGGAGYIGSLVVRLLLAEQYRVRLFDNFVWGRDGLTDLDDPNLEVLEGDMCDVKAVSDAIAGSETVILLAAIVGRRIEDVVPRYMREVNLLASSIVLDAAIEHGADRFIFASTDSVYGMQSGVMYETGTPDPVSLYSRLKLRMEEQVIKAKRKSFHPTALRIATCYGFSPRMRFDLVVNSIIRDAACRGEIRLASGEQCRALIHVEDCARAVVSCVKAHVSLVSGEIFNVGSIEQTYDLNALANIAKTLVPETHVELLGGRPDLTDYRLSSSKIQKILDFSPRWTVEQAMRQLLELLQAGHFQDPYDPIFHNT